MKFMTAISALFAAAAASVAVSAAPLEARDVWNPKMTYPTAGTVWESGNTYEVTWDTSDAPSRISNPQGFIILRDGDLELPLVLAHDFDLLSGQTSVNVPLVYTGSNYSLVLFGDSGNWGEAFTINGFNF